MNLAPLQDVLRELQLTLVHVEDWILVQRANFDLHISEEPYHAVQLYANLVTRKYVVRVWGRTWDWETLKDIDEVRDLCIKNFRSTSACLGYLGPHPGSGLELMEVHFPCSRWISESCAVLFAQRSDDLIIGLCPACSSDKVDIKEEDTKLEEKIDPLDMPNHFLVKEEHSTDSALREEIENEPDTALCQSSDDSTGRDILVSFKMYDNRLREPGFCITVLTSLQAYILKREICSFSQILSYSLNHQLYISGKEIKDKDGSDKDEKNETTFKTFQES